MNTSLIIWRNSELPTIRSEFNINILNLYLKSYNKSNVTTINSDSIHIFDYKQSSNMPILSSNNADIKTLFDLNKIKTANVII